MSGYLLDTHVLLWWLTEPDRLPAQARTVIADTTNPIYVSAAAIWEMAIKKSIGRLEMPSNLLEVLEQERIGVLAVQAVHALRVADLPLHHQDPFDRMQVAQVELEAMTLITHDQQIQRYDVPVMKA